MGQKVHPYGFRLGIIRKARSHWFAEGTRYRDQLLEDLRVRSFLLDNLRNAGISEVLIERHADNLSVTVRTAKPGIVIGRGGRDVDLLRQRVERMVKGRVRLNVEEAPDPDLNAQLVAENIAGQIERRISHRRAMQQATDRALRLGALGIKVAVSGRLGGAEIARTESVGPVGRVPLHTLRADVEYGLATARTAYGRIGVKCWVYRGEILPPKRGVARREQEEGGPSAEDWERVAAAARRREPAAAAAPAEPMAAAPQAVVPEADTPAPPVAPALEVASVEPETAPETAALAPESESAAESAADAGPAADEQQPGGSAEQEPAQE